MNPHFTGPHPAAYTVRINGHPATLLQTKLHKLPLLARCQKGDQPLVVATDFTHCDPAHPGYLTVCTYARESAKNQIRWMIERTEKVAAMLAGCGHMDWPLARRIKAGNWRYRRGRKWKIVAVQTQHEIYVVSGDLRDL